MPTGLNPYSNDEELRRMFEERETQRSSVKRILTPWRDDIPPPSLYELCNSPLYLGSMRARLTPDQYGVVERVCGKKAGDVFRPFNEVDCALVLVLMAGKAYGKNFGMKYAAILQMLTLDRMRAPRLFLEGDELAPEDAENTSSILWLLNVSTSAGQAEEILFTQVAETLRGIPYVREHYKILDETVRGGSHWVNVQGSPKDDPRDLLVIKSSRIELPRANIVFAARPSLAERSEGGDVAGWFFDEVSGFIRAHRPNEWKEIESTLTGSSVSRYGLRTRGWMSSYPRELFNDPIIYLYDLATSGKVFGWEGVRRTTLEGRTDLYEGPTIQWRYYEPINWIGEPYKIPDKLWSFFDKDQSEAEKIFLLRPPKRQDPFLQEPWIRQMYSPVQTPNFYTRSVQEEISGRYYTGLQLIEQAEPQKNCVYGLSVDTSRVRNRTVAIVGHTAIETEEREIQHEEGHEQQRGMMGQYLYIDGIALWEPNPAMELEVSLVNTEELVITLARHFQVRRIETDRWTPSFPERFARAGLRLENYTKKRADWDKLRANLTNNLIRSPYSWDSHIGASLMLDLQRLKDLGGGKVGFPEEDRGNPELPQSPDLADALVLLVHILGNPKIALHPPNLRDGTTARARRLHSSSGLPRIQNEEQGKITPYPDEKPFGSTVRTGRFRRR